MLPVCLGGIVNFSFFRVEIAGVYFLAAILGVVATECAAIAQIAPATVAEVVTETVIETIADRVSDEVTALETLPPTPENLEATLENRLETRFQGVVLQEGEDTSARLRATLLYPLSDQWLTGAEVDLAGGEAFGQADRLSLQVNELYAAFAPASIPELRIVVGLIDLTSYFNRNSFVKIEPATFLMRFFRPIPSLVQQVLPLVQDFW